jgi:hypothetical protein
MRLLLAGAMASIQIIACIEANAQDPSTIKFSPVHIQAEINKTETFNHVHQVVKISEPSITQITRPTWATPEGTWSTTAVGMPCMISSSSKTGVPRGIACQGNAQ